MRYLCKLLTTWYATTAVFWVAIMLMSGAHAGPGDYKGGYESADYETRSVAVDSRADRGQPADLMAIFNNPPLGLPAVPVPADNPVTAAKVKLGRKLFYDRRLSLNDTMSCAMCHVPEQGFANNELALAVGLEGRSVRRNSPTLYNVAYVERLFHDGRETSLEQQAWIPLLMRNEMANPAIGAVINKLRSMSDYDGLFEAAFDGRGPGMETIGAALASYQRTLISANSPFDRWFYDQQEDALNSQAQRGYQLFSGKALCSTCHLIGEKSALFTDHKLHNTGVGWHASMAPTPKEQRVLVAPGIYATVTAAKIAMVGHPEMGDVGLYEITQNPNDRWRYKTPGLRNVALTAPYMHDGSLLTLADVVAQYNQGGYSNEGLSPLIQPLDLNAAEQAELVAFLESLTGDNVDILVSDGFAAPVGDLKVEDPHWSHEQGSSY
jgi:cytochrome c peroxidase